METPLMNPTGRQAAILGSVTLPGRPSEVCAARSFVRRTLSAADKRGCVDSDAATLLTSELVTNAIQHTASGAPGGTVTVVVVGVAGGGMLIEVIDDGAAGAPVVRSEICAPNGHGLYLVQQIATQWGYLREAAGTTVWFHLAAADGSARD
jgi:anti-sigma regulatory factor (Ser/Thr protein kinase)